MWFEVDQIHELHRFLGQRQLEAMRSDAEAMEVRFVEDLYQPFSGGWQFSVRNLDGIPLVFHQP
jgi:hypothetical protein